MRVASLVLAAGRGERLGHALPKAFVPVAGRSLLARSLESLASVPEVDWVVPVIPAGERQRYAALAAGLRCQKKLASPVDGGEERQDSVYAGLQSLPGDVGWVAVHDAARALVRPETVSRVIEAARREGAAILALPVSDTIKRVRGGRVVETPPRSECYAAQTPQVFRVELLREAIDKARAEGRVGTDCSELVEALGAPVHVVEADADNLKITRPADLEVASRILEGR
jgi:2-C-methyl-D-erythritol 4-phosphate cytidylyltransferase